MPISLILAKRFWWKSTYRFGWVALPTGEPLDQTYDLIIIMFSHKIMTNDTGKIILKKGIEMPWFHYIKRVHVIVKRCACHTTLSPFLINLAREIWDSFNSASLFTVFLLRWGWLLWCDSPSRWSRIDFIPRGLARRPFVSSLPLSSINFMCCQSCMHHRLDLKMLFPV